MKKNKFIILVLVCFGFGYVGDLHAEELCPGSDKWPTPSGAEELKMHEKDFTIEKATKAINFLENDVINIIKEHEHKSSYSILDFEGFYIGYPNNLNFIKGTLLRQEAIIRKDIFENEQHKMKNGTTTKENASKAEKAYLDAKKLFCEFLKKAEYVD